MAYFPKIQIYNSQCPLTTALQTLIRVSEKCNSEALTLRTENSQ